MRRLGGVGDVERVLAGEDGLGGERGGEVEAGE
jgi:hypothetical protein